jgi:DNA repair protein RadA/Sms
MAEERTGLAASADKGRGGLFKMRTVQTVAYNDIESQDDSRQSSGIAEFDRVLGGGIVPGSLVLIGGDPGIGKSTLLLQVSDKLTQAYGKVLYVSGEESERQIKLRGERLRIDPQGLFLLPETCL